MASERARLVGIIKSPKKYYFEVSALFIIILFIFIVCLIKSSSNVEYKIIETNNGKVRGIRDTSFFKRFEFYSFKGIPYAKIPTEEYRFKVSFVMIFVTKLKIGF